MDKFASSSNELKEQIPEQKKRQNNTTLNKVTSFCLVFLGVIPEIGSNIRVKHLDKYAGNGMFTLHSEFIATKYCVEANFKKQGRV